MFATCFHETQRSAFAPSRLETRPRGCDSVGVLSYHSINSVIIVFHILYTIPTWNKLKIHKYFGLVWSLEGPGPGGITVPSRSRARYVLQNFYLQVRPAFTFRAYQLDFEYCY